MKEKLYVNSNTHIIARNDFRFLATNDYKVTINDISALAFIIDKEGNVINDNESIGVITKFGYWEAEDTTFELLKKRLELEENIQNALLGIAFSEVILILDVIFDNKLSKSSNSELLIEFFEKYNFTFTGLNTEFVISLLSSGEKKDYDVEKISDDFIEVLQQFQKYKLNNWNENVLNLSKKYDFLLSCDAKELESLILLILYHSFNNRLESINEYFVIDESDQQIKMGIGIYLDFIKELIKTKDKYQAFKNISMEKYSQYFSSDTMNMFKDVFQPVNKTIRLQPEVINPNVAQTLMSAFYSVLNTNNYLDSILTALKFKENSVLIAMMTGFASGIIYKEKGFTDDMLISLTVEEDIKKISMELSKDICFSSECLDSKLNRIDLKK